MSVTLAPLPRENGGAVAHLALAPGQDAFVAPIERMLGEPTPGVEFHLIRAGSEVVGFFKIDPPGVSTFDFVPPEALGLRGFLIGAQYQGRGFGRAATRALPAYLAAHYPFAAEAVLAVDEDNPAALASYLGGGWKRTGAVVETRSGPAIVLRLDLCQR